MKYADKVKNLAKNGNMPTKDIRPSLAISWEDVVFTAHVQGWDLTAYEIKKVLKVLERTDFFFVSDIEQIMKETIYQVLRTTPRVIVQDEKD